MEGMHLPILGQIIDTVCESFHANQTENMIDLEPNVLEPNVQVLRILVPPCPINFSFVIKLSSSRTTVHEIAAILFFFLVFVCCYVRLSML